MVAKAKLQIYCREEASTTYTVTNLLIATVARIAYQCSDVVYSVQPNFTNAGPFSPTLDHLYSTKATNVLRKQVPQVTFVEL